jgi:hypothetical protein
VVVVVVGGIVGRGRPGQRFGDGSHAPIGARVWVGMTVSPDLGCSVRPGGRVAGACGYASAPGTSLLRWLRLGLQLDEDVEGLGQQPTGDGHRGDVVAPAPGQLGVGAGEHGWRLAVWAASCPIPRTHGEPCLVMWPWRRVRSQVAHLWGQAGPGAQLAGGGKRPMSPISATSVIAVSLPMPGRIISAWTRGRAWPTHRSPAPAGRWGGQGIQQPATVLDDPAWDRRQLEVSQPGPPRTSPQAPVLTDAAVGQHGMDPVLA